MKINQFSITSTTPQARRQELMQIHLLRKNEEQNLTPNAIFEIFLARIHMASAQPIITKQWLHDLLATPDLALDDWFDQNQILTDEVFYLVALQLLDFEAAVDFDITDPLATVKKIGLPVESHQKWTTANVTDAFYLLLNTHNKNGQSLIDHLTAEGFINIYHIYYYLATDEWQREADLDKSAVTVTGVTTYRADTDVSFLEGYEMTPENGAASLQECVAIERIRLTEPTAFSSINYEVTTLNRSYLQVSGINLANAIYEEVYDLDGVRYRLCYQMDTPNELKFVTVENY